MERREYYIQGAQTFKSEYEKFKKIANDYENSLKEFDNLLKVKINDIDISQNDILKNSYDGKLYVVSKNKIIMRINDDKTKHLSPSKEFNVNMVPYEDKLVDIKILDYSNLYYSTKIANHINDNITENTIVQVGIEDLAFEDIDNHSYKKIKNDELPTLITNSSSGYCSIDDAYQCQSKAKMYQIRSVSVTYLTISKLLLSLNMMFIHTMSIVKLFLIKLNISVFYLMVPYMHLQKKDLRITLMGFSQ